MATVGLDWSTVEQAEERSPIRLHTLATAKTIAIGINERHKVIHLDTRVEIPTGRDGKISKPGGIAIHPTGNFLAISDRSAHRISLFRKDSNNWQFDSIVSKGKGSADGQVHAPLAMVWILGPNPDESELYVADSKNRRIQLFMISTTTIVATTVTSKMKKKHSPKAPTDLALTQLPVTGTWRQHCQWWERDADDFYLGQLTHDQAVHAMCDCKVGDWRIRRKIDGTTLALCYQTQSSWRRADIDECLIQAAHLPGGPFSIPSIDKAKTYERLTDAIQALIKALALDPSPLNRPRRPKRLMAIADPSRKYVALYLYAPPRNALFDATCTYAGITTSCSTPSSVAFTPNNDLAVGDDGNRILILLAACGYLSIAKVISIDTHSFDTSSRLEKKTFATKGGPPFVRFWGTTSSLVCIAGGRGASHLLSISEPSRCRAGDFTEWPRNVLAHMCCQYLAYADTYASLQPTCRVLKELVTQLRQKWQLPPLDESGLSAANTYFDAWSRPRSYCVDTTKQKQNKNESSAFYSEADRLRNLLAMPLTIKGEAPLSPYALHHHDLLFEAAKEKSHMIIGTRKKELKAGRVLDFSHGAMCAVTQAISPKFWWRYRATLAEDFVELAQDCELTDLHGTHTVPVLDRIAFHEFWLRLQERYLELSHWPKAKAGSPGSLLLLRECSDGFEKLAALPKLDPLRAHIAQIEFFQLQTAHLLSAALPSANRIDHETEDEMFLKFRTQEKKDKQLLHYLEQKRQTATVEHTKRKSKSTQSAAALSALPRLNGSSDCS